MPKGYLVAQMKVTDPQKYSAYGAVATELLVRFSGKVIVRPDTAIVVEGDPRPRTAIFEFDSFELAKAFWESEEYQKAKLLREGAADADFILIEGI